MNSVYSLGSSHSEQARLFLQREIYGDTHNIKFIPTDSVVEFGCGVGANLWIAQVIPKGRYTGIDNQPSQIEKAQTHAKSLNLRNVDFKCVNAAETGLPSASADVSFCRCVLIHQSDPFPIVKEMQRVTKPGGRIVLIEPHGPTYYVGPDKPNLLKCFRARNELAYGGGRGSPDVAVNLYPLLMRISVNDIVIHPHVILVRGTETNRCRQFLRNLLGLTEPVAHQLISRGDISREEWQTAIAEASQITPETFLTQTLWVAEARVA